MEIPDGVWICCLPNDASTGEPDGVTIWLRDISIGRLASVKEFVVYGTLGIVKILVLKTMLWYLGGCFWYGPCPCLDER